ncbi:MAG: DinB family protein [Actinomycetota bacterium]
MSEASLQQLLKVLRQTPASVRAVLDGVDEDWAGLRPSPSEWSAKDILSHLVFGERTDWVPRIRETLATSGEPRWAPFDRAASIEQAELGVAELLDTFDASRLENIVMVEALRPSDLVRTAIHPELGRVSLRQLIATWATHDLTHVAQICEALAARNRQAVGPWRRYLPALDREVTPE